MADLIQCIIVALGKHIIADKPTGRRPDHHIPREMLPRPNPRKRHSRMPARKQ